MTRSLPAWFDAFLAPGADRPAVLAEALRSRGLDPIPVELAGGRYVVAWPRRSERDPLYRMKVLTAHHDRVPGTPGALDNSAACLQLVEYLAGGRPAFNTVAIFTDREELAGNEPSAQGSYALGRAFSGMGLGIPLVFSLDVTGRGDVLVLSRASEILARDGGVSAVLSAEVAGMAETVARLMAGRMAVTRAGIPFGEDLGFLAAGIPALALSVLPRAEAAGLSGQASWPDWASPMRPADTKPDTWRRLHGPGDRVDLYEDGAFELMATALERLGSLKAAAPLKSSR